MPDTRSPAPSAGASPSTGSPSAGASPSTGSPSAGASPSTGSLQRDQVLALARLAHVELSAEETDRLTGDLASILAYVRQLEELDVTSVPPTAHLQIEHQPLREDEELPSLPREAALAEAPRVQDEGFAVPAFVDEG